ncbi:MAG: OprD family porin [Candidatus Eremiobacteraeota bacterium]|nr:OprD family porin [Candidatus Eremiobacteraeota bacterium]
MFRQLARTALIGACGVLFASAAASAQQATPAPAPTATPSAFTYSGTLRAFYFTRSNLVQNGANPNRTAFNFGGKLHGDYRFGTTPFSVGASYYGADPFGANGSNAGFNPRIDNTLPGFSLSTLGEAYLQYKTKTVYVKAGNQNYKSPWAPDSDSRIKPALYQGADVALGLVKNVTLGLTDVIRFQNRTSSVFDKTTLLTGGPIAGGPNNPRIETNGFAVASLGYKNGSAVSATLYDYAFYNIANLVYGEAKFFPSPKSPIKPYVAAQFVHEHQAGQAVVGIIDNTTYGMQVGATFSKNVDLALGYDQSPEKTATLNGTCAQAGTSGYFIDAGGTSSCRTYAPGTFTLYYGGIASPYSDSYATDPLYTTSISQGAADRHSTGRSFKLGGTFQTSDKRVKLILSQAYYDYSNGAGANTTKEFDADATYFFNKVTSGTYRGLSLRHRYADRVQPTLPFDFKYNRTQLQYDF